MWVLWRNEPRDYGTSIDDDDTALIHIFLLNSYLYFQEVCNSIYVIPFIGHSRISNFLVLDEKVDFM